VSRQGASASNSDADPPTSAQGRVFSLLSPVRRWDHATGLRFRRPGTDPSRGGCGGRCEALERLFTCALLSQPQAWQATDYDSTTVRLHRHSYMGALQIVF